MNFLKSNLFNRRAIFDEKKPKNYRHEFKYILNESMAAIILKYVENLGLRKTSVNNGGYKVTSLYFDTPSLHDYYAKIGGFSHRKKLRARIYDAKFHGGNDPVWLEVKEKHDMNIFKRRASVPRIMWNDFIKDWSLHKSGIAKHDTLLNNFCSRFLREGYMPQIVIRYDRIVFEERFLSEIRMTFDSNIEACKWRDYVYNGQYIPVKKGQTVLEIKFREALPWWFGDMVRRFHLSRSAFSKYTNSIDAVNRHNPIPK